MDAIEYLNLGAQPDDGTGDSAREGGAKLNRNAQKFKTAIDNLDGLTLVAGPVTKLAPGANPTANLTGTAPNYTLSLGLPEGAAGAGAPNSVDILAIPEMARLERQLVSAGVPGEPSLILDFIRGVHFASKSAIAASISTLVTALGGVSSFSRASTATYFDSDGLLKTAADNVPRIRHDPVTGARLGLMAEDARTNFAFRSEELDSASWGYNEATVVANSGVSPTGLTNADKIVPSVVSAAHNGLNYSPVTVVSGQAYGASIFVKAGGYSNGIVRFGLAELNSSGLYFDLVAGTITGTYGAPPTKSEIIYCGNGWFRLCWQTQATASGSSVVSLVCSVLNAAGTEVFAGNGTDGLLYWGAQFENGWPSSYIPTGASAVTRAADRCSIDKGKWLRQSGTLFVEARRRSTGAGYPAPAALSLGVGDEANIVAVLQAENSASQVYGVVTALGSSTSVFASPAGNDVAYRAAMRFGEGETAMCKDGGAVSSAAIAAAPALDRLLVGWRPYETFDGTVSRILFFPNKLSDAEMQGLTALSWS